MKRAIVFLYVTFLLILLSNVEAQTTEDLQRKFIDLRFGAFYHFGIMTFTGDPWATPNQDISKFNPINLDCNQWAEAAVNAKMKFGIFTTKHHDGFCLWDSKYTENDVANTPWKNGKGDVVREFVDAFRAHNLEVCFYYSIWDNTKGVGNSEITEQDMDFIKGQLSEILTNYGEIKMLFLDGWSWKMGHNKVPYDEIRAFVKKLQPNCLLVDNTHLYCLYDNDLIHFEAGEHCPSDNTIPALQSALINKSGGNDWFWDTGVPSSELLSVEEITDNIKYLESIWCNFILNCPPNREGRLDAHIVSRLKEVGEIWTPDLSRAELPKQAAFIEYPVIPVSATATSGEPEKAIDGINDRYFYSVWESSKSLPQSITIDLGEIKQNINTLYYVPKYQTVTTPVIQGSIKKYKIFASEDNIIYSQIDCGEWNGDTKMKVSTFVPVTVRFIKLEAITAVDDFAAVTEIEIGTSREGQPINNRGECREK